MPADSDADAIALEELLALARSVQERAYAPYSEYRVGAAIRSSSGRVFLGCNVENAAYPEGTCAEAGAIAAMAAAGEREIEVVVVVADGPGPTTPCGGCRQKIREFATAETVVYAAGPGGIAASFEVADLLPSSFGPGHLGYPDPGV
jgi:cytidine deaminase